MPFVVPAGPRQVSRTANSAGGVVGRRCAVKQFILRIKWRWVSAQLRELERLGRQDTLDYSRRFCTRLEIERQLL